MPTSRKLPSKIKLGRVKYNLKHVAKKTALRDITDLGECDYNRKTLTIFGAQTPMEYADSVIHESMHFLIHVCKIPFKNRKEEEKYVRRFSGALTKLFKDNPELLSHLKSVLDNRP